MLSFCYLVVSFKSSLARVDDLLRGLTCLFRKHFGNHNYIGICTVDDPPCDESGIFIPDAFSPNNDASNDLLFVRGNGIETLDFQVLDRWGKEVFRTNNQNEGWNGRHRQEGKELSPDVYAYCVKVTCFDGTEFIKAGNVSLLR